MKIVIAGGGKVGGVLCSDLSGENHDVVIIDRDSSVVDSLIGLSDIAGLVGNGANPELLREAGVSDCDVFIAVTESDEINIIASIMAHKLGAHEVLARVRNPEYSSQLSFVQENLGISMLINPEMEAARAIMHSIRFPSAISIESFAEGRVQMVEVSASPGSQLDGMPLTRFREMFGRVLVCIVQRGDDIYIPAGSFVLREGDLLHVTGPTKNLPAICKVAGCFTRRIRSAMIIGGSSIARYLLRIMDRTGMDICIIERNRTVAESLASEFGGVKVIAGDGTDQSLLEEHHIESYDCLVALTGIDEETLITSLYAAKKKVPKIVTKVNRTQLLHVLGDTRLQTIVTPKRIVADKIIRFIRAMSATQDSKLEALYRIVDDRVEVLQFEVLRSSAVVDIPLRELQLKNNILIAYLVRGDELIYPGGDDMIFPGDHVIAVTFERDFDEVDDLLVDEARK
ncbi:MAG: Trk system potassium transporter TrkA [Clostridiales bacterium]|nr:Trk system potassium transporter TrkA [Clostridiales bacterium]